MNIKYIGGVMRPVVSVVELEDMISDFLENEPILEVGSFLIDVKNVYQRQFKCIPQNCDFCVVCEGVNNADIFNEPDRVVSYTGGCCTGGCCADRSTILNIKSKFEEISEFMDVRFKNISELSGWNNRVETGVYKIKSRESDNSCVFSVIDDYEDIKCALHLYAKKNDLPLLDYKPIDCALFPMDVISVNGKILLTSLSYSNKFTRWGEHHCSQSCLTKKHYGLPMYQNVEGALVKIIGQKGYDVLDKIYHTMRWKKTIKDMKRQK